MEYIISFLEGIITFISPCMLPMLPIYCSYFTGTKTKNPLFNACGFVLGFTIVFLALGVFAGTLGSLLYSYKTVINIITGSVVLIFGLNFIGVIKLGFLNKSISFNNNSKSLSGFLSAIVFGIVFSVSWTPCIGIFLGSALMLASQQGSSLQGMIMLLCYSLGLGIPFIISSVLMNNLKNAFDFIKKNYRKINIASGLFLVIIGLLMMTGLMGHFLALLTF